MKKIIIIISIAALVSMFVFYSQAFDNKKSKTIQPSIPSDKFITVMIKPGTTFGEVMEDAGIGTSVHQAILSASEEVYDLTKIRAGRTLTLVLDHETNELKQLVYPIDTEEELFVTADLRGSPRSSILQIDAENSNTQTQKYATTSTIEQINTQHTSWIAERIPIAYEISQRIDNGIIESSLFETGLKLGMDERTIIALADVLQWSIDFAWGVRSGDTFTVVYEERYRNGEYVMPGEILAVKFVNDGKDLFVFYFEPTNGHYDKEGNSVQKIFLKAPLAFKYISSGFTTKPRYVSSLLGWTTNHQAIDYAAPSGTPVRSVGDGTVISAGWNNQGYGNLISIRHNETYTTNYAHMSRIYVHSGQTVSQNEVIGTVGSTGFSTGPHLHYEMIKRKTKINPLTEELPPGEAIDELQKAFYLETIQPLLATLDKHSL